MLLHVLRKRKVWLYITGDLRRLDGKVQQRSMKSNLFEPSMDMQSNAEERLGI